MNNTKFKLINKIHSLETKYFYEYGDNKRVVINIRDGKFHSVTWPFNDKVDVNNLSKYHWDVLGKISEAISMIEVKGIENVTNKGKT